MKIELKNVHWAAFASKETNCFNADVWIDGVKSGHAENDGNGGQTMIHPRELETRLAEHCKTLPAIDMSEFYSDGETHTMEQSADHLIDTMLADYLYERDVKKRLAKYIMFTKPDQKGIWRSETLTKPTIAALTSDIEAARKRFKADKILNALPLPEAVALYKEQTQ